MLYNCDTFERDGRRYVVEMPDDISMGEPWKEHDGHGIVSDWTTRDKKPGEVIIAVDAPHKRYYDVQETMKIARRDGWASGSGGKRKQAAKAVFEDCERMRQWCNDGWTWIGCVVTLLDTDGEMTDKCASLWGIESDAGEYLTTVANELADEIAVELMEITTLGEPVL